mmetsp:Transcript_22977/g.34483  ORF Transcript_22977/g.34483 Transcript_22977/m.34483 type:complete len:191 (-) Transcript_22977:763-1335(-)|eukprot:CAMPEP_0116042676 /NCGR_PEP_ID=MMETSP0321-20121206/25846_1 /TAXON_ID=163516 /ORGANISM="Leptocylindrus danicus var. danicus, Strain B650" /LENGTH=190 /DNA_ID=CAMNT_0003523227 /DNA_START=93 /DNA_END=665 /DNA_ORIENTATION=-
MEASPMNGHSNYTMFNALKDNQFQLALSVLVKIFDDQRASSQISSTQSRRSQTTARSDTWQCNLSPTELAVLRWDTTCAIEGVILKLFQEEFIQKFRNSIVEVAHFLEKTMFHQAVNVNAHGRRDTLLYRMKQYSRADTELTAWRSSELYSRAQRAHLKQHEEASSHIVDAGVCLLSKEEKAHFLLHQSA